MGFTALNRGLALKGTPLTLDHGCISIVRYFEVYQYIDM